MGSAHFRLLWLRFYRRQDMRTLIRELEATFGFFGGTPREVLFDQHPEHLLPDAEGLRALAGLSPQYRGGPNVRLRFVPSPR